MFEESSNMNLRNVWQKIYCRVYLIILCICNYQKNIVVSYGPAIGDTLFSLAYIQSLSKKKTIFVCAKGARWVCNYYDLNNIQIKTIPNRSLARIANGLEPDIKRGIIAFLLKKNLYITCARGYMNLMSAKNWNLLDFLKIEVFKCQCDFRRPLVPQIECKKFDIPDNSILLSFSNSAFGVTKKEWEDLASYLLNHGYHVFTNCKSLNEQPIKGTKRLVFTMEEIYNVVDRFHCLIGMRSGFYDFVIDKAKRIICINPDYVQSWWNLKQWGSNCDVINISHIEGKLVEEVVNVI